MTLAVKVRRNHSGGRKADPNSNHMRIRRATAVIMKAGDVLRLRDLKVRLEKKLRIKVREDYLMADLLGGPYYVNCKERLIVREI